MLPIAIAAVLLGLNAASEGSREWNDPGATDERVATTRVFSPRGKPWGFVKGNVAQGWYVGTGEECTVFKGGRTFDLSIGHTEIGAAVPSFSILDYKVWATPAYKEYSGLPPLNGYWLRGRVLRRSATRWDFYSRRSRLVAYAIGRDGPAAGVAELLLGPGNIVKGC
jgi:hypothetical protein